MIIPRGTEISVDVHGQLSVRTPGNLVLQNSGTFGSLESTGGSIRIDRGVEVEASTLRCADACYIGGSLTAWKVTAASVHLEQGARAHIVLQETDRLDVGRDARLVGNFASEDELFLLFSRFARQVRALPFYAGREGEEPGGGRQAASSSDRRAPELVAGEGARALSDRLTRAALPEPLGLALALLERELDHGGLEGAAARVAGQIVELLREQDLETLRFTHRTLFDRIEERGGEAAKAARLVETWFSSR